MGSTKYAYMFCWSRIHSTLALQSLSYFGIITSMGRQMQKAGKHQAGKYALSCHMAARLTAVVGCHNILSVKPSFQLKTFITFIKNIQYTKIGPTTNLQNFETSVPRLILDMRTLHPRLTPPSRLDYLPLQLL